MREALFKIDTGKTIQKTLSDVQEKNSYLLRGARI